jgi:hypothetical protein
VATYENDSNDSVGRRRRGPGEASSGALELGDYGTGGRLGTIDDDGLRSGDLITAGGVEFIQAGGLADAYRAHNIPVFETAQYGPVVPYKGAVQFAAKTSGGDAVTRALDAGAGFWALAGAFATAVVGPSIFSGVDTYVAAEGAAVGAEGAGAVQVGGTGMEELFVDNWDLLQDPSVMYQQPQLQIPGQELFVDNWDLMRDPTVQYQAPEVFNSPLTPQTPYNLPRIPTIPPGVSSGLQSLARSIFGTPGGSAPNPYAPGVARPGANNFVFLPGGATAGAGTGAVDSQALLWVLVGVGLIVAFSSMKG